MKFNSTAIKGHGRGKKLGYPTINLLLPPDVIIGMTDGIYSAWAYVDGEKYPAALYLGPVPVFEQTEKTLELHLINALYISVNPGDQIECDVVGYIRPVMDFGSPELLVRQMGKDVEDIKKMLKIQ